MSPRRIAFTRGALAASLAFAISAQAAQPLVSSAASLSDFSYTLVDLNPGDGVAAAIHFNLYSTGNVSLLNDTSAQQGAYDIATLLTVNELVATSRHLQTSNTDALGTSSIGTGLGKLTGSAAASSGYAQAATSLLDGVNNYRSSSFLVSPLSSFTVTKNTMVIFFADAFASASTTGLPLLADSASNFASAEAYLELVGPNQYAKMGQAAWASADTANNSSSGRVAVTFYNFSNAESQGSLYARALSEGSVAVAAVPEPGTYALLLAGLGLVGAAIKRRRN